MIHLLAALMLAPNQSMPMIRMHVQDRNSGATAVIDKDMRPVRPPDCKTDAETMRAVNEVRNGEQGECFVKDVRAFNRHGG